MPRKLKHRVAVKHERYGLAEKTGESYDQDNSQEAEDRSAIQIRQK